MTLILNNDDVKSVLTMEMTMRALEEAYQELAQNEAVCRPRIDIQIPTKDPEKIYQWGTMEGGSVSGYFAIRMKSDVIYEQEYQGTRVGADSGIGVKYMAREDARVVGMMGSGGMARTHIEAFFLARKIDRVQVYSPTRAHRLEYAREITEKFGVEAVPVDKPQDVYKGAHIVAGCTDSTEPVIIPGGSKKAPTLPASAASPTKRRSSASTFRCGWETRRRRGGVARAESRRRVPYLCGGAGPERRLEDETDGKTRPRHDRRRSRCVAV